MKTIKQEQFQNKPKVESRDRDGRVHYAPSIWPIMGKLEDQHIQDTGHRISARFWDANCVDCGWHAEQYVGSGDPFNPNKGGTFVAAEWFNE